MYHIYISLCLWIYLSFWEETPFPFFPNIHIKFVLKQSANFIYGCRKVAENLPPRLFASTPGRRWEREGDQFMKCKSLFLGSLLSRWVKCGMLWQWLHECRNERTGTCGIYIYIYLDSNSLWACSMYEWPDASIWGQELMETGTAVSCRSSDKLTASTFHGKWKTT